MLAKLRQKKPVFIWTWTVLILRALNRSKPVILQISGDSFGTKSDPTRLAQVVIRIPGEYRASPFAHKPGVVEAFNRPCGAVTCAFAQFAAITTDLKWCGRFI